jgi:hypothetical protein
VSDAERKNQLAKDYAELRGLLRAEGKAAEKAAAHIGAFLRKEV